MHQYTTNTSADVSLTGGTAKTVLQLATPSSRRAKIKEFAISFSSITATDQPVLVELVTQTDAGAGGSAATPVADDPADPAALCSALSDIVTTPPTSTTVRRQFRLTPVGGMIVYQFPEGDEIYMAVSTRIGLRVTAPQNQSGVRAHLTHGE